MSNIPSTLGDDVVRRNANLDAFGLFDPSADLSYDENIVSEQLSFYRAGLSGCEFAKRASVDPVKYGWYHFIVRDFYGPWAEIISHKSASSEKCQMVSLLFPNVVDAQSVDNLVNELDQTSTFSVRRNRSYGKLELVQIRALLHGQDSWVSGFGPYEFFAKTRRTRYTELVYRVKSRPEYSKSIQPKPHSGCIHVADLHLGEISKKDFEALWRGSFRSTKKVLGHHPDETSAARTTLVLPN